MKFRKPDCLRIAPVIYTICDVTHSQHPIFGNRHIVNNKNICKKLKSISIHHHQRNETSKKAEETICKITDDTGIGTKTTKTSNRQQRQLETDSNNVPPVVSRSNTRTFTDIQTHNDGNNHQNDTSMNAPTPSTSGWPGRNPSHTQTMHDARTHGHTSAESSIETLCHTQVSGTETHPVEPAQNTDHELIYQRAAVSQPIMQNDVSMAPISTRAQSTADPRSQSNAMVRYKVQI